MPSYDLSKADFSAQSHSFSTRHAVGGHLGRAFMRPPTVSPNTRSAKDLTNTHFYGGSVDDPVHHQYSNLLIAQTMASKRTVHESHVNLESGIGQILKTQMGLPYKAHSTTDPLKAAEHASQVHNLQDKVVFHGTPFKFEAFSDARIASENLYGPGHYFTESPETAYTYAWMHSGGFGRSRVTPGEVPHGGTAPFAPSVRAHKLDLKSPFDIEAPVPEHTINAYIAEKYSAATSSRESILDRLRGEVAEIEKAGGPEKAARSYSKLALNTFEKEHKEGEWLGKNYSQHNATLRSTDIHDWSRTYFNEEKIRHEGKLGDSFYKLLDQELGTKAKANKWLEKQGYDSITHVGGRIMGNDGEHQVWIALHDTQIKNVANLDVSHIEPPSNMRMDPPPEFMDYVKQHISWQPPGPRREESGQLILDLAAPRRNTYYNNNQLPVNSAPIAKQLSLNLETAEKIVAKETVHELHVNLESKIGGWLKKAMRLPFKKHSTADPLKAAGVDLDITLHPSDNPLAQPAAKATMQVDDTRPTESFPTGETAATRAMREAGYIGEGEYLVTQGGLLPLTPSASTPVEKAVENASRSATQASQYKFTPIEDALLDMRVQSDIHKELKRTLPKNHSRRHKGFITDVLTDAEREQQAASRRVQQAYHATGYSTERVQDELHARADKTVVPPEPIRTELKNTPKAEVPKPPVQTTPNPAIESAVADTATAEAETLVSKYGKAGLIGGAIIAGGALLLSVGNSGHHKEERQSANDTGGVRGSTKVRIKDAPLNKRRMNDTFANHARTGYAYSS